MFWSQPDYEVPVKAVRVERGQQGGQAEGTKVACLRWCPTDVVEAVPLSEATVDVRATDKAAVALPLVGLLPHVLTRKERIKGSEA